MKKQTMEKKRPLWLTVAISLVAVATIAVCLTAVLCGCETQQPETEAQTKLYWNVEKYIYSTIEQIRSPRNNAYYIRFAVDGEQVDLPVADPLLVEYIDTMEVMGLVFDDNGVVVDVLSVEELGYTIVAEDDYVESFTEDTLICNSLGNLTGLRKNLTMTADTRIYMVDEGGSLLCGLPGALQPKSRILAIADESGKLTHVYAVDPFKIGDIYWNHARQYDSVTKLSTRPLDELGRFVYQFSKDGEQMTLYTRDQEVANAIDGVAARCMGLEFDENGYITGVISTAKVTGGKSWGSWYYVMDIDGNVLSGKKFSGSNIGATTRGVVAADCKVYDVSGKGAYVGEPTELRQYDQVHGLKNEHGEVCILFVVSRTYQSDIYYNVSRKYDSVNKTTTRVPSADGYYYLTLAHEGQQVTLKTRNKDLVSSLDSISVRCFGLKVEGDEILDVYTASTVWGGRQFCSYDYVKSISPDGVITVDEYDVAKNGNKTYVGKMAADCGVYNVSSTAGQKGEKTTLQVGDKIHALKDLEGNVTHIFVVGRTLYAPIYWNVDRQYNTELKTTKRTPNEEGYYEIVLAINGEQKTYKTKSLSLITQLDAVSTRCFGLVTNGDIILKMYATANVSGGTQFCSWDYVTDITGATVTAQEASADKPDTLYRDFMTMYTKVYDVSGNGAFIGEETQLRVGDKVHALKYATGGLNIIYVVERTEQVVEETAYCELCEQEVTWYSWDGTAAFEADKHYYLKKNVNVASTAYIGSAEDSSMEVTLDLRGYDISASVRAFRIYGTFHLLDSMGDGTIYGKASGQATGFYVYDSAVFNMYGGTFVGSEQPNTQCGIGALGLKEGSNATFNMYGGSLQNGNTNKDGGNLTLYHSSVFNMYGGSITGGRTQEEGGNISLDDRATMNLYGGTITGGVAANMGSCVYGGKISLYSDGPVVVDEIYLKSPMKVADVLAEGSSVTVTLPSGSGAVTGETPEANLSYIHASEGELVWKNGVLMLPVNTEKTAYCEHCQQEASWTAWDGETAFENGGHYYLLDTISVAATAYIGSADDRDMTVCLDLNGQNINANVRVFRVYGNLNLMDSAETDGVITGNNAGQASVFYVYEHAVFNLYGGTLTATKTVTSSAGAGIGGVDKGTMNMYGGTITGGTAKKNGGNLNLYGTAVLNLYGGSIENGTSLEAGGGNIQMSGTSQLHIYGGSILGGTAAGQGDCVNANGSVTLHSRDVIQVSGIYLPEGKTVSIDGVLAATSAIGIELASETGVFTETTEEANLTCFPNDSYDVVYEDGKLALQQKQTEEPTDPDAHLHCVCGGLGQVGDHSSCTDVEWTPWPGADALVLDGSVYYYLTEDVTLTSAIKLEAGQSLHLCLNGRSITTSENIYIFDISGSLDICDHAEGEGAVTNNYSGTGHSRTFYLRGSEAGSSFCLYGGTFSAPNAKSTGVGGTVARVGTTAGSSTFKMYAGSLVGSNAASNAVSGNLVLEKDSTTYLYGGQLIGGTNTKGAGNVMMKNGAVLVVDGGSVTGGSGTDGGNVYVKSGCTLSVLSGTISGGNATGNGADVYAQGTVSIAAEAVVEKIYYPE